MLGREKLDSLCKDLDKFIQDNMYIEEAGYKLRGEKLYKLREKEEELKKFISEYKTKSKKTFPVVINDMGKELYPDKWDKDKSDLWKSALISKHYCSQTKTGKIRKLNKYIILSIGFAFNSKNLLLKNKLKMTPKNIMNELFLSRYEEIITVNYHDPFDLVIIFCIEKLANEECDITDVDHYLKYQGLPWFSEILLKGFPTKTKKDMIISMLDKIKTQKIELINQKYFTKDINLKEYNEETYIKKELENLETDIKTEKLKYEKYFDEQEKNNINNTNMIKEPSFAYVPVETIYLPEFKYYKEHNVIKERTKGENVV